MLRGTMKVVLGIGGPLLLLALLIQSLGPRPDPAPEPASLDERTATEAGHMIQLVGSPDGEWALAGEDSFLGYRIVESYPRLNRPFEAAGRTSSITGRVRVLDGALVEAEVRADLRDLTSDQANRDRAIQVRYLESETYPFAAFELDEPVRIGAPGEAFSVEATGHLTIRQVTRRVRFPLEGRWDGDQAQVVGQLPIRLSDFEVAAPDIPGYVSVDDEAVVEVNLRLRRG